MIYGAGDNGIRMYKWLELAELKHMVSAFCDKDYKSKKLYNIDVPIMPYEDVREDALILVSVRKNEEVIEILKRDGREFYLSFEDYVKAYHSNNKRAMDLISEETFEQNDDNELLQAYFNQQNYKVVEYNATRERCYIFFSSNGIYYPSKKGIFFRTIYGDRYEWETLVSLSDIPKIAAKCIYVRDLRRAWYATGINSEIDSVEALAEFLQKETQGYEVITVGISAGGYAAALFGAKLNARMAFAFSAQFSIYEFYKGPASYFYLNKNLDNRIVSQYYNICETIKDTIPIVYFYPKENEEDIRQAILVKDFANVMSFPVITATHGLELNNRERIRLLQMSVEEIKKLYDKNRGKCICADNFLK